MIKINLIPPSNSTKWVRWCSDCIKETQECLKKVARGEKLTFKQKLYGRRSIKKEYFLNKNAPFYGKCAYCESYIPDFQHGDIDHFRPKGGVTDENGAPIFLRDANGELIIDENGNTVKHPGYYWLAYDWKNLLPTCTVCNQPTDIGNKKIGKHYRFPVKGKHAQNPTEIADEHPLLINPTSDDPMDDPELHLSIDKLGIISPLTERGEICIEVFGLNIREQLIDGRRQVYQNTAQLALQIVIGNEPCDELKSNLKEKMEGKKAYSLASRAAIKALKELLAT